MKVARLFLLLGFSATFGSCSSDSSTSSETTGAADSPKTIEVTYDSTAADKKRPMPANVPATEYAAPAKKAPAPANQ